MASVDPLTDETEKTCGSGTPGKGPRRRAWAALIVGVAILASSGILYWGGRHRVPQYLTAAVSKGAIRRSISMTGSLNPVVTVQVGSYVSGTIKSLRCDYNTEVRVGQVCATIDPVPFQLIVDQDKAQVGTAEAQLKKDEAALEYARTTLERNTKLLKDHLVSQDTVDSSRSAYEQAVAQVGLDKATVVEKEAQLKAAEVNLAYTNIVSPVIGTVITRNVDVGQTVAATLQSPTLFLIAKDLTQMQVDTNVSEADVGEVRLGQDAYFAVQAFPRENFHGKVTEIRRGPITVQNVVTYDVVVAVPNPDRKLFPGMTADTHIVIDEHEDVLRVPLAAVRFTPEWEGHRRGATDREGQAPGRSEGKRADREHRSRVWILDGGALRAVPVATGIDDGVLVEVSGEGLEPGQAVVLNQASSDGRHKAETSTPNPLLRQGGPRL